LKLKLEIRGARLDKRGMRTAILGVIVSLLCSCSTPYPKVPLAAPLSYAKGEEALMHGELAEAERQFRAYLASDGTSYRARARYQLARAQYQMEDYAGAELSLDELDAEFPGFGRRQVAALRGDIAYALGQPVDAIVLWAAAYEESNAAEKESLRPRIAEAMQSLDPEQAKELAAAVTEPEIYEMAIDRLAGPEIEVAAGGGAVATSGPMAADDAGAGAPLPPDAPVEQAGALGELTVDEQLAMDTPGEPAVVEVATVDTAMVADESAAPAAVAGEEAAGEIVEPGFYIGPRVAALLPLTGSGRDAGRGALVSLRNSIDAATLVVRDTGSDPAIAAELVRQLAADRDVIAVLGPMLPPVIEAVRREARSLDLPILPLPMQGSTAVAAAPAATAASPAGALAEHAVRNLKVSRIGILAPSESAAGAFADAARSLGATIAGTHVYGADDLDLNAALIAVQSWIDGGGIDAVYVADAAPRAIQLAKAARAAAPQVVLLGDAGWNDAGALAADAPAIEGAVIAAAAAAPPPASEPVVAPAETIPRAAAALQRAIALGETDRGQTQALLATIDRPQQPAQTVGLMKIVGGRAVAIR
jgi:hypothetical protein